MLGNKLKDLRQEKGIEAQEMAKILNVAKSTYSGYENNKSLPSYDILKSISTYFNVSTDYLLGLTDFKESYRLFEKKYPALMKESDAEYIDVDHYTKKYGLSKKQVEEILQQAIEITRIAKDK